MIKAVFDMVTLVEHFIELVSMSPKEFYIFGGITLGFIVIAFCYQYVFRQYICSRREYGSLSRSSS